MSKKITKKLTKVNNAKERKEENNYVIDYEEEIRHITIIQNDRDLFFAELYPSYIKISDNFGNELDTESNLYKEIMNFLEI